jgi:predicted ATP-grasp superfamily ATP-dependent carboligase
LAEEPAVKVFVTDGDNRAALAVTRSLGRAGHHVIVGEKRTPSLAQTSRYCAQQVVYPDPVSDSDAFVDFIVRFVEEHRVDVLLPIADITTFLVTQHRRRIAPACAIPFAPANVVARAADKIALVQTATRLGVPVPRSVVANGPADVAGLELRFPLVVKPHQSRVRTAAGWMSTEVSFADSRDALVGDLSSRGSHEFPVLLQERIEGPGMGVFALYHEGRAVTFFSHRRLRERPPWGGVSVLSESVPVCPRARGYATALLDDLGWHGVAMVEFKQDVRDGVPRLMEINGRFWGSLQLAIDAGVDFPALLVAGVRGGTLPTLPPYRIGVRNRWFWGDVDSLLLTLSGRGGAGSTGPGRLRAVLEFMKLGGRDLHYENPKLRDIRPWLFESMSWVRREARATARTLSKS